MSTCIDAVRRALPRHGWLTLALAGSAAATQAATVQVRFDSPVFNGSGYDAVGLTVPRAGGQSGTTSLGTVGAGRMQGTASNLVGIEPSLFVDSLDDLYMYCYDVYERVGHGWTVTYTVDFNSETARTLDFLGAVNAVINRSRPTLDPFAWLHPVSAWQGAAIQLGIWESLYDTGTWDLAAGNLSATGVEVSTADWVRQFFGAIADAPSLDPKWVMILRADGAQDMITGDPPSDVPAPATFLLALTGLVSLAASRRRRVPS